MASSEPHRNVILVTGAYGLLGSWVVPFLSQNIPSCQIVAVGRKEKQLHANDAKTEVVRGDLRDEQLWASLPNTITHVFHLAAVIPWKAEERYKASLVTDN